MPFFRLKIYLSIWEIFFLLFSVLLLIPQVQNFLFWMGLPNLLSPFFSLGSVLYSVTEMRIQRDELLKIKSEVKIINPLDSASYFPVRFKGRCRLLDMYPLYYPERLSLKCGGEVETGDLVWALGLVGRVTNVKGNTCEVLTLHSKDFYIKVVDMRSGVWGMLKGGTEPTVSFIPEAADVRMNDTLMAYDHPGVRVGVVDTILSQPPFLRLYIKPLWRYYLWTDFALLKPVY